MSGYHFNLCTKIIDLLAKNPSVVALRYDDGDYTFSDLCEIALTWIDQFEKLGLKNPTAVAIKSDKSAEAYAALLACNIMGITYAHLDPASPLERENHMISKLQPSIIINFLTKEIYEASNKKSFQFEIKNQKRFSGNAKIREVCLKYRNCAHGDTTAYVMFTSGSTGVPKGVAISQSSLLNFINWVADTYGITSDDRFTGLNQAYFDNSIFDFYGSVLNGSSLIPIFSDQLKFPSRVIKYLKKKKASIWFTVPSYLIFCMRMKAISKKKLPEIKAIIFGGEAFPKTQLIELSKLFGGAVDLYNVYGPTEATCICSSYKIKKSDLSDFQRLAPLGKIAPNFGYDIVGKDEKGIGELILRGPQIAQGYINDVAQSSIKFDATNSFGNRVKSYKTGDLVSEEDGDLHFHGRLDNQIKHMGYRIELEEIEAYFLSSGKFVEAIATYGCLNSINNQITLHLVSNHSKDELEQAIQNICKRLPGYMTPQHIQFHKALPKNANGKVDRHKLNNGK